MQKKHHIILFLSLVILAFCSACTNPFAPALNKGGTGNFELGNQKTVEGVFKNFSYAYKFKDTLLYGKLLHDDFTFLYRNYDKNIDPIWTRAEDMNATARMFSVAQDLNLIWNEILSSRGDSLDMDITRSFSLTITFSPTDIVNVFGRAIFYLKRDKPDDDWKILQWRDESNF